MRPVITAAQMRVLDATTIEDIGLPGAVLMENAGRAVAREVLALLGEGDDGAQGRAQRPVKVAVVCGAGNNGGDGYVIARCLRQAGVDAIVYLAARAESVTGDARLHLDVYRRLGGPLVSIADEHGLAAHAGAIAGADAVVDAVFGTGLGREVRGHYRAVIEAINGCPGHRVAVDIPSGLSADTGQVLGAAVDATCTVTMAFLKIGLVTAPGHARCGRVRVAEIGIPSSLITARQAGVGVVEAADMAPLLPALSPLAHKNRRGHALVVAGSPGKRGAGRLVAWAALRTGAGLVTLASPWTGGEVHAPDPVMTEPLDPDALADALADRLRALAHDKQALAMGPGMPATAGGRALVLAALSGLERIPLLLDADALNHLRGDLAPVAAARVPVVLTPHPGEAARLLGCSNAEIQADRLAAARTLSERSGAVVVLKGARTVVCWDGLATINPTGHPALATAGSGDVLAGVIAALLAQGLAAPDAARLGVYIHGLAGERAAASLGARGVTAADLSDYLPAVMADLACDGGASGQAQEHAPSACSGA